MYILGLLALPPVLTNPHAIRWPGVEVPEPFMKKLLSNVPECTLPEVGIPFIPPMHVPSPVFAVVRLTVFEDEVTVELVKLAGTCVTAPPTFAKLLQPVNANT